MCYTRLNESKGAIKPCTASERIQCKTKFKLTNRCSVKFTVSSERSSAKSLNKDLEFLSEQFKAVKKENYNKPEQSGKEYTKLNLVLGLDRGTSLNLLEVPQCLHVFAE